MASVKTLTAFIGNNGNKGTIGYEALLRARKAGLTDEQIKQQIQAEGLHVGEKARHALGGFAA